MAITESLCMIEEKINQKIEKKEAQKKEPGETQTQKPSSATSTKKTKQNKNNNKIVHTSMVIVFNPQTEEFSAVMSIQGEPETVTSNSLTEILEYQNQLIKSKFFSKQKKPNQKPKAKKQAKTSTQEQSPVKPLSLF